MRADDPGGDAIDADVVRAPFHREVPCQLQVGGLGDAIGPEQPAADQSADRGHDDDRALLALRHGRQGHLAQPDVAVEVGLHDLLQRLIGGVDRGAEGRVAGRVAHHDVDLPPLGNRGSSSACSSSLRPTLQAMANALPPAALIAAAVASQASALRLEITTRAPWAAICSAIALPMPRLEPVIRATLPVRSNRDMAAPYVFPAGIVPRLQIPRKTGHHRRWAGTYPSGIARPNPLPVRANLLAVGADRAQPQES